MAINKLGFQLTGTLWLYNRLWWRRRPSTEIYAPWNYENRAIFVHIPKTAGTSLFEALQVDPVNDTHAWAVSYKDQNPEFWQSAFTFTIVRNPWDRLSSAFHFLKDGTQWPMQQEWAQKHLKDMDFETFVYELDKSFLFRSRVKAERFFWPQTYWACDRSGSLMVKHVYYFEKLDSAIGEICNELGLVKPDKVPHARNSKIKPYQDSYNGRMIDFVSKFYQSDVAKFGYKFG